MVFTGVDLCCVCLVLEVPNLVFLAVSPEEKESWINALNAVITRAKNRILDEVTAQQPNCQSLVSLVKSSHSHLTGSLSTKNAESSCKDQPDQYLSETVREPDPLRVSFNSLCVYVCLYVCTGAFVCMCMHTRVSSAIAGDTDSM